MPSRKKKQHDPFSTLRAEFGGDPYGIKTFRKHLAVLKKAGLISKKTDVRSQAPTRHYLDLIRSLKNVVTGTAKTIAVAPREKPFFEQAGYRQRMGRAIVPVSTPAATVRKTRSGGFPVVKVTTPAKKGAVSVTRESVLAPHSDLPAYLEAVVMKAPEEAPGTQYGFKFFGNYSRSMFANRDQLLAHFMKYTSLEAAIAKGDPDELDEIYRNFEMITINGPTGAGTFQSERAARKQENARRHAEYKRRRRHETREWHEPTDAQKAARATAERERRARMKSDTDPTALIEYREKAKTRMQKVRARRKKE